METLTTRPDDVPMRKDGASRWVLGSKSSVTALREKGNARGGVLELAVTCASTIRDHDPACAWGRDALKGPCPM